MAGTNSDKSENIVDSVYSRFILRDALGKMVPGLILVASITATLVPVPIMVDHARSIPSWGWLAVFGLSWLAAFALQSFGERTGLFKSLPPGPDKDLNQWYKDYLRFKTHAAPQAIREHERFVVIMEACGNASVALLVSAILLVIDGFTDTVRAAVPIRPWICGELLRLAAPLIALMFSAVFLWLVHYKHRERHFKLIKEGLKLMDEEQLINREPDGNQP